MVMLEASRAQGAVPRRKAEIMGTKVVLTFLRQQEGIKFLFSPQLYGDIIDT